MNHSSSRYFNFRTAEAVNSEDLKALEGFNKLENVEEFLINFSDTIATYYVHYAKPESYMFQSTPLLFPMILNNWKRNVLPKSVHSHKIAEYWYPLGY